MALTRITKGVIKPNENYDTHNINSTGIITATGGNITGNLSVGGVLTYEDVTSIDSVGLITARGGIDCNGDIDVDGHTNLDNISIAGVTTVANDTEFIFGTNATATRPLKISHTSSSTRNQITSDYIDFNILDARFKNFGGAQIAQFYAGNAVNLFFNGTQRFSTASAGANVYGNLQVESTGPYLILKDTDHNSDFALHCNNGSLQFVDTTNSYTSRMNINSSGNVSIVKDLDVDGHTNLDNVSIAGLSTHSEGIFIPNEKKAEFGGASGTRLQMYHSSSDNNNSFIKHTGSGALKIAADHFRFRNAADSSNLFNGIAGGAITLYYSGQEKLRTTSDGIQIPDAIRHLNDTNTAIRFPANDTISLETDGSEKVRITGIGSVGIGTDSPQAVMHIEGGSTGNLLQLSNTHTGATTSDGFVMGINSSLTYLYNRENKHLTFGTNNLERVRIDSDGRLLVGPTSARVVSTTVNPYLQLEGTAFNQAALSVTRNTNDAYGSYLILGKTRATSNGGNVIVQQNDIISEIRFAGSDGNDLANIAAMIRVEVDGTAGTDQMPGAMTFRTNSGGTSASESMRITKDGFITKPRQAMFEAYGGNNTFAAQSPLPYPLVRYNIGSCYDNSTYKFTAPTDGYYQVMAHVIPTDLTATNNHNVELYVIDNHGTRYFLDRAVKTSQYSSNNFSVGGTRIIYADTGDTLWLQFHSISGTPKVETASYFSIMLVA